MSSKKNNRRGRFDIDMSPFRDLMGQMDSFFNHSFKQMNSIFNMRPFWVDLDEYDSEITVTAELPGYKRNEIELEMIGHRLRIAAQRNSTHENQQAERTITLPFPIPKEETKATFHDGLLKVTIPKTDPDRKYINITDEHES